MKLTSERTVKPVHVVAVVTLVAAGTWGGAALAASPGVDKPAVAPTSSARAAGPAYVYRTKTFPVPASSANNSQVMCPAGYKVSGGGVQTGSTQVVLNETRPVDGGDADAAPDDGWNAWVVNPGGTADSATVYAVCAKV